MFLTISGQTHRQEEEDEREVLQLEPLLERVLCLPHRRDGHEEGRARRHGKHFLSKTKVLEKLNVQKIKQVKQIQSYVN